ncbi:hypothetical protein ElyMa_004824700 [Elysia marginata]|uniref:Tyrosine-protein kinase ephrin type A/B receptor-like domain-containing protein n=1 Tax=Elysia marginata TaxID=1093978 RepID=A0AAV4IES6_9GAST|nr:hypothetical protein ElyMa_004824700 [Elysia marginata]
MKRREVRHRMKKGTKRPAEKGMQCCEMQVRVALSIVVLVAKIQVANSYVDRRGLPCANTRLLNSIPSEYVTWDGSIEILMNCMKGHDMPLTTPDYNIFQCKPDGSDWNPPIFPDCNSFGNCKAVSAIAVCDISKNKNLESVADLGLDKPHLFFKIEIPYRTGITGTAVGEDEKMLKSQLESKLEQLTGAASEVSSRVKPDCPAATVGVVTEADRLTCRGCPLGHYLDVKLGKCKLCPPGYYNDLALQVACKLCPSMRDMTNTTIWNIVKTKSKDGSYAMVLCPTIQRDRHGNFKVRLPPEQPPNFDREVKDNYALGKRGRV